jgi:hypothetical protein
MLGAARRGARGVYRYTYGAIRQLSEIKPVLSVAAATLKKKPA